jgi:glutamate-1-semialdehyde aminotransferase
VLGVTPGLSTFAKVMAGGYPVAEPWGEVQALSCSPDMSADSLLDVV